MTVRVVLPAHLKTLAQVSGEVEVEIDGTATPAAVLDALEARFPPLRGTMRDHTTKQRRPSVRFFAGENDLSLEPMDTPLPPRVVDGTEVFAVIGAMSGG